MWSQYNVKCSPFLPVQYNALRKILQHTEAVVQSLNELKSSIALELKLSHSQEFIKLFPLPHYFKINNLPSVASAIQTNEIWSCSKTMQHHKHCNNNFIWNFCTIHTTLELIYCVVHTHCMHARARTHTHPRTHTRTHTHTYTHTKSVIKHFVFCIQILSTFLEFSTA
jgi:hypothetical protein